MLNLGSNYKQGTGVEADPVEAIRWYRKAVDAGNFDAMAKLGYNYEQGIGVEADPVEANRWYRKAVDAGNFDAMANLGYNYEQGIGVEADPVEANRWYRKAADAGNARAMFNLGNNYQYGRGVEADPVEANRWYRKAADAGNTNAMVNLGINYQHGRGVEAAPVEAIRWCRKAADAGNARAMFNLGVNYQYGTGVEADPVEAIRWYRKAADAGDTNAMVNLGINYQHGRGVEAAPVEAIRWYRKAADAGNARAIKSLAAIERQQPEGARFETTITALAKANWPLEPLIPGEWTALEGEAAREVVVGLLSFTALEKQHNLSLRTVRQHFPAYYPGFRLIEALFTGDEEQRVACVLVGDEHGILLNGTSPPIHMLSKLGAIDLSTPEQCVAYLHFFCMAVCGDEGHFHIAEEVGPTWFARAPEEVELAEIASKLAPLQIVEVTEERCKIDASVKYGAGLFRATFSVVRTGANQGMVEMLDDTPILIDQPFLREGFDGPFRKRITFSQKPGNGQE